VKVAADARVSTSDQEPETQLVALRDVARVQQWESGGEFVDHARANDPPHRTAWRNLLDDAAQRRFQAVLVFKLDRAFRSVKHRHETPAVWEAQGSGVVSAREGFDTRTALGRLLLNLLASLAEFDLEVRSERVQAGTDRTRRQGVHIGRPPVTARAGFAERCARTWRPAASAAQRRRAGWIAGAQPCCAFSPSEPLDGRARRDATFRATRSASLPSARTIAACRPRTTDASTLSLALCHQGNRRRIRATSARSACDGGSGHQSAAGCARGSSEGTTHTSETRPPASALGPCTTRGGHTFGTGTTL